MPSKYKGLSTGVVGAIGELIVAADLLSKGYEVFRAVSQAASCDLIVLKAGACLRIEVRTNGIDLANERLYPLKKKADAGKQDHFAMVLPSRVVYLPPL